MNHHVISPKEYRALIEARDAAIRDLAHWAREAGRWRGIAEGLEIERDRLQAMTPAAPMDRAALRVQIAEAARQSAEGMREAAAQEIDCGCEIRDAVLAMRATHGHRRAEQLCIQANTCCALAAAAIRALPLEGDKP